MKRSLCFQEGQGFSLGVLGLRECERWPFGYAFLVHSKTITKGKSRFVRHYLALRGAWPKYLRQESSIIFTESLAH
jgi:hypothetical protein